MATTGWTDQTTGPYTFRPDHEHDALIEVEANAGSVALEYPNSTGAFVIADTISEDSAQPVAVAGWNGWRITASGGASYRFTY